MTEPNPVAVAILHKYINDRYAIAHCHLAIEDEAIARRDGRLSTLGRANGIHINERDGSPSAVLRIPTDEAVSIALNALALYAGGHRSPHLPTELEGMKYNDDR